MNRVETFKLITADKPLTPGGHIYNMECLKSILFQFTKDETVIFVTVFNESEEVSLSSVVAQVTRMYIYGTTLKADIKKLNTPAAEKIYNMDKEDLCLSLACIATINTNKSVSPDNLKLVRLNIEPKRFNPRINKFNYTDLSVFCV